eukprot:182585_1
MSITISNSKDTTESRIVSGKIELSCPQTAEQKDTEIIDSVTKTQRIEEKASEEDFDYNPNEETQPESGEVSPDEEAQQYEQKEEEYDEEAIEKNLLLYLKRLNILRNEIIMQYKQNVTEFTAAFENVKYIEKCDKTNAKLAIEHINSESEFAIEGSKYEFEEAFENIVELCHLCETSPHLNSKIISWEEFTNILDRIFELEEYEKDGINENCTAPKIEILYVSDRIANSWRPYAMYIILFNINPYIKEMFYEASYVSTIAACLFQLSTFNWQILKRTIFISAYEAGSNFLSLAMMIIAQSLFLYVENDLNTIDYISVFLEFVALFLLICGTGGFDAWHVDKKRKLIILIGVNIILLYQY